MNAQLYVQVAKLIELVKQADLIATELQQKMPHGSVRRASCGAVHLRLHEVLVILGN